MSGKNQIAGFLSFNISKTIGAIKLIFCMQLHNLLKLQTDDTVLGRRGQACPKRLLKLSRVNSAATCYYWFELKSSNNEVLSWYFNMSSHQGTITWTGIICKKIPCYMRDPTCRWHVVKKGKVFWRSLKHSWILPGVKNCRILISLCAWVFMKTFRFLWTKIKFSLQSVTILIVIISLYYNKTEN